MKNITKGQIHQKNIRNEHLSIRWKHIKKNLEQTWQPTWMNKSNTWHKILNWNDLINSKTNKILKKSFKKYQSQHKLIFHIYNLDHETKVIPLKTNLKNKETRFLPKQILKDEIKKKNQYKTKQIAIKKIRIKFNIQTNWN